MFYVLWLFWKTHFWPLNKKNYFTATIFKIENIPDILRDDREFSNQAAFRETL